MSGENQRTPLVAAKLASAVAAALQPPVNATEQELRVAKAVCEADSHAWPDDSYNGRAQIRAFLKLARAALSAARVAELEAENARLRIALHDAIRRPLGVTPDSAVEFYSPRMADEAEARRPRLSDRPRPTAPVSTAGEEA
ncbi:hypothetical protein DA075_09930 [Methylobacterium currus]|uniref:Uncharacterized protein n=1 Tax=Methylobacterium currus TaxID=2051553 RepID=A0A2R4WI21_9HYPH|nr:hypothetical protein [Methylobacterium currus]AWB21191.1 hypothetical protein DA075_09930 [Methylobacterium currus]